MTLALTEITYAEGHVENAEGLERSTTDDNKSVRATLIYCLNRACAHRLLLTRTGHTRSTCFKFQK